MHRRWFVAAGAIVFPIVAIGAAHMPFARSFLMRMGGCPMAGGAHMTAVEGEAARHLALRGLRADRGTTPAPARPALGFTLDQTTATAVRAWAKQTGASCEDARDGLVKCEHVAPASLGVHDTTAPIDELSFEFDTGGLLVNMTTWRSHLDPELAATAARAIVGSLTTALGPADKRAGNFDAAHMTAQGAGSISTVMYRYTDYVADVTAMNAPSGGPSIREHYMSARD